jgi:2-polyprenyl-6-methoxyphenol hydroxylase-like FAD-dependent oxidoreductase
MTNRILIVGGGLTGLALAAGLRHRGVDPVVVEQAPAITEAGWGIGLSDPHITALDRLGISDRENWARFRPDRHLMFDGGTGLLDSVRYETAMLFSRTDLQQSLYEPIADLVRTGVRPTALTDLGDTVDVEFDDGMQESFDAVIGADGINSWTRRHVLGGPDATYTGVAIVRFHLPNPDPTLKTTALSLDTNGVLGYFLMDGGRKYHGIVKLPGEGDAAHAMSPILAQGTGVGLQDAALLAELLTTPDLAVPIAFASYEKLRKPPTQAVQRESYEAGLRIGRMSAPTALFPEFVTHDKPA